MELITSLEQLEDNIPFKALYKGVQIIVIKTSKGIFALEDRCSHEEFPLSLGMVSDNTIECIKHGSTFDLDTGQPLILPALLPVKTFDVVIEDNLVYVKEK